MKYLFSAKENILVSENALPLYEDKVISDFVEVSYETFTKFTGPCELGKVRGTDANGSPTWKNDTQITASEKIGAAILAIDSAADAARTRDQSIGQLLDIEYQQVIEAHSRWYADGYDETKCPEEIQAWANAEGVTPLQAAQEIAEAAARREEVIRQIRSIRLAGKAAVRAAADDADFTAIAGPFIDQLNHIGETTIAAA